MPSAIQKPKSTCLDISRFSGHGFLSPRLATLTKKRYLIEPTSCILSKVWVHYSLIQSTVAFCRPSRRPAVVRPYLLEYGAVFILSPATKRHCQATAFQ